MSLYTQTTEGIDALVREGRVIGRIKSQEEAVKLPHAVDDWTIRTIPSTTRDYALDIIAIPTGSRTRVIYNEGRMTWLRAHGFTQDEAEVYFRASQSFNNRWDDAVAIVVKDNMDMTTEAYYKVHDSNWNYEVAKEAGIVLNTVISRARLIAALQIALAIQDSYGAKAPEAKATH